VCQRLAMGGFFCSPATDNSTMLRVPRPEALGDEGTEELPPPPDVAPGNVAPCEVEGGAWSGTPMPNASMKSETSSKLVEIGAGRGDAEAPPAPEKK
jgi:hypothetical protein